jgi:hypothetical protein
MQPQCQSAKGTKKEPDLWDYKEINPCERMFRFEKYFKSDSEGIKMFFSYRWIAPRCLWRGASIEPVAYKAGESEEENVRLLFFFWILIMICCGGQGSTLSCALFFGV